MGQYYTPIILMENGEWFRFLSHNYDNGLKLMEHSYQGNNFINVVLNELVDNPSRLAWVGDYAEISDCKSEIQIDFVNQEKISEYYNPPMVENDLPQVYINHSKMEYFVLENVDIVEDNWGCKIHPLPLLTAMGNGYGGGDYRGINQNLCGIWACDIIEISNNIPNGYIDISNDIEFKE